MRMAEDSHLAVSKYIPNSMVLHTHAELKNEAADCCKLLPRNMSLSDLWVVKGTVSGTLRWNKTAATVCSMCDKHLTSHCLLFAACCQERVAAAGIREHQEMVGVK